MAFVFYNNARAGDAKAVIRSVRGDEFVPFLQPHPITVSSAPRLSAAPSSAQGRPAGQSNLQVAGADFNGDGKPDAAILGLGKSTGYGMLTILFNAFAKP